MATEGRGSDSGVKAREWKKFLEFSIAGRQSRGVKEGAEFRGTLSSSRLKQYADSREWDAPDKGEAGDEVSVILGER